MKYIRYWVYKLGFKPRQRSIFFSPSLHVEKAFKHGIDSFRPETTSEE